MRLPAVPWLPVCFGLLLIGAGFVARLLLEPAAPDAPAVAQYPSLETPSGATSTASGQSTPYWQDPSIDPQVLRRAFAPPGRLAVEALPFASELQPSAREWRQLERTRNAIAN